MSTEWIVTPEHDKARLDVYLSTVVAGLTRSQAKKQIESGAFLVNGKVVSGHHFLKPGDVITRSEHTTPVHEVPTPNATHDRTASISGAQLLTLKETDDWIVVYKPHGVLMHPDHDHPGGTLIDAIIEHAPEVAKVGEDPVRPGIVSRLDKDVSGIVVVAKTQSAFEALKKQFAEHSVEKEYIALVYGEMEQDEGDIRFRIARSGTKARMAAIPETSKDGQAAWTHYTVIERFKGATLLKLQILTGRTHQIRAHMLAMNHPVVGDVLYQPKSVSRKISSPRILLQSVRLAFNDPKTGERESFDMEQDLAFEETMKHLR